MSAVYADLVVPRLSIADALERRPLGMVRQRLDSLRDLAGVGPAWRQARLLGLDRAASAEQVRGTARGTSVLLAPIAGVGFADDDYLETEPPEPGAASPVQEATIRARYRRRAAQIEAVNRAARVPTEPRAIDVAAAIDLRATSRFDFSQGYRRRLAHLLAFEASLRAGSLDPYTRLFPALTGDTPDAFRVALPEPPALTAYSVTLNLAAVLREATSYEDKGHRCHPDLGEPIRGSTAKAEVLRDHLAAAGSHRRRLLHEDARRAMSSLQVELDRTGILAYTGATVFPFWGLLADPDCYADE